MNMRSPSTEMSVRSPSIKDWLLASWHTFSTLWDKLLLKVSAADEETLRLSPQRDRENIRAVAELMILVWVYQATVLFMISLRLLNPAGHFRPRLDSGLDVGRDLHRDLHYVFG